MKNITIFLMLFLIAGTISGQRHTKITYKREVICHYEDDYSGTDTIFVLIDGNLVKVWNKYDEFFKIYDSSTDKWKIYLNDYLRNRKIYYEKEDTLKYYKTGINTTGKILGYKCTGVSLVSEKDTLFALVTNKFGVNYSPSGTLNGFALHYDWKTKHYRYIANAVEIDNNTGERITVPGDYQKVTASKYFAMVNKALNSKKTKKTTGEFIDFATFPIDDINGKPFDPETKKGKILVYNFWAIGCGGCVKEIPDLNKVVEHYKNNNEVEFYAFTIDSKSNLIKFLRRKPFYFNIIPNAFRIQYMYSIYTQPTTILIDRKGKAVKFIRRPVSTGELIEEIDKLLNIRE